MDMRASSAAVALSGGMDSAVAALMLKETGYQVLALHAQMWEGPESQAQRERVEEVCQALHVPLFVVDLRRRFSSEVVEYFVREYSLGRTPNPCVVCNRSVKFGALLERAESLGAAYLATGHYARSEHRADGWHLLKARDRDKNQSYFLYLLTQKQLKRTLFPLGARLGSEINALAQERGLPTSRGSQDLCFVAQGAYRDLVRDRVGFSPGAMVDTQGRLLGTHGGIELYTVGQRHGLGLGSSEPLYVVRIDPTYNRVVVGGEAELWSSCATVSDVNWIPRKPPSGPVHLATRIRYRAPEAPAVVTPMDTNAEVHFDAPQWAVAPGQAMVFYDDEELVGGGAIESTEISRQGTE